MAFPASVDRVAVPIEILNDNIPEVTEEFFNLLLAVPGRQKSPIFLPGTFFQSKINIIDDDGEL